MYHIAICDDDKNFISYLKRMLLIAKGNRKIEFKIYEFSSGEEFVWNLDKKVHYDLLILDMKLGGMDGDETARIFRKRFPDSVLAFCSGVCLPTIESFKTTPFRYLLKSHTEEEFVRVLEEILDEVERTLQTPYIIGHYRWTLKKIKLKDILYIETSKRGGRIIVCPTSREIEAEEIILIDKKPGKLLEELQEYGFALVNNACLVNMDHIDTLGVEDVVFDSGESIKIARAYQKSFKEAFAKRFSNKYD